MSSTEAPEAAAPSYLLTSRWFLRALGAIDAVAFLILALQGKALLGKDGLLPVTNYLGLVSQNLGGRAAGFGELPSVFWLDASDTALSLASYFGLALSLAVMAGFGNAVVLALIWVLYLSFVHVGQIFYGYGWDMLLCETGFLAIFLAPPWRPEWFGERSTPPLPVIVLGRWLLFRLMFGAGLIKIRGDECWRDLTCLYYHYETQPNPGPLSYYFHHLPRGFQKFCVLFNHYVELVAPFGVFGPRTLRWIAGISIVLFQGLLILSGNLSFLNWLTIAIAILCFDDGLLLRFLPKARRERLLARQRSLQKPQKPRVIAVWCYAVLVLMLSFSPVMNLLSPGQRMNASFDPFELVNTYGAFGSVGRVRHEVVLEGTLSEVPDEKAVWKEYQFPCKPGDVTRRPCLVTPYHYRLSWQLWFAALHDFRYEPWILNLVYKLLRGETRIKSLIAYDPFPNQPPRYIRARLYRYRFTESRVSGAWWERELDGEYLRPLSLEHRDFRRLLSQHGWLKPDDAR